MRQSGKTLAVWGIVLQAGPLVGMILTVVGMIHTFEVVRASQSSDAAAMAEGIHLALWATAIGLLFALTGAVLILIALWGTRYRAPWFYVALWAVSIFWLFTVPVGTVLGVVVMVYLATHRGEFVSASVQAAE